MRQVDLTDEKYKLQEQVQLKKSVKRVEEKKGKSLFYSNVKMVERHISCLKIITGVSCYVTAFLYVCLVRVGMWSCFTINCATKFDGKKRSKEEMYISTLQLYQFTKCIYVCDVFIF